MPTKTTETVETPEVEALPPGSVRVRITKLGDGKVSTGEEAQIHPGGPENKDFVIQPTFKKGAFVVLPESIAKNLEKRGFAEIED